MAGVALRHPFSPAARKQLAWFNSSFMWLVGTLAPFSQSPSSLEDPTSKHNERLFLVPHTYLRSSEPFSCSLSEPGPFFALSPEFVVSMNVQSGRRHLQIS